MKKLIFVLIILFAQNLMALVSLQSGSNEIEAPLTAPSSTNTFSVIFINEAGGDPADNFSGSLLNSDYTFLGGNFPGIGGTCPVSGSLAAGSTCEVLIEFSPTSSGDNDDTLTLNYETTDFLGTIARELTLKVDGHSEVSGSNCNALAPSVSNIFPARINTSSTTTVSITGNNFSPSTSVNISGLTVNSTSVGDFSNLTFDVVAGATPSFHDVILTNECGSTTVTNGLEVSTTTWFDMRVPAQLAASNPVFTSAGISGYTIDPTLGMQVNNTTSNWLKFLRFDGVCGTTTQSYDIVIYRQANARRFMVSLWNQATQVDPYPGTNAWQRQYVGYWDSGTQAVSRIYGTQTGEGGTSWNQGFVLANIPDGNYYRYHFSGAGQNGQTMQIWQVDANLNDIALIRTFTSGKPASPATNVCPGIAPFDAGNSDYYITAVRVL